MRLSSRALITFLFSFMSLTGCSNQILPDQDTALSYRSVVERPVSPSLTQEYAAMRAKQISDINYTLSIVLDKTESSFQGQVLVDFTLAAGNQSDITLDFNGGTIHSLLLDGEPVEWRYNEWFITLPAVSINTGKHRISINYSRPYAIDGDGLHRYQDAETGRIYLYTNFEPYNANKLLPLFDQPNLKASYTLDVIAPSDWQVISATREHNTKDMGDKKHWFFSATPKIPSYIFPLHAGPYYIWQESYKDDQGEIPMRLFARQELAEHVVTDDWFTFTRQSFDFFNSYFDLRYPFQKYDQVIVPEFNAGAMENLAAVTFSERYVIRGEKTEPQRMWLANVIAHEMAHMWFGNLVTMDWWNGLWLNESFATYMAYLQLSRTSDFEKTWDVFYAQGKLRAYSADEKPTTHAIELGVADTASAFSNFDAITYSKGASTLKQLPYFLGQEKFRQGIASYLQKHAYANTELSDFIGALEQAANTDLQEWTQKWLYQAGLNSIEASFSCENNLLKEIEIHQSAPEEHPILRPQRTLIGLYEVGNNQQAQQIAAIPALYAGARTTISIPEDLTCPDFIYPNLDDFAYVKVILDSKSRATLQQHINQFEDDGLRSMLWQSQWDDVMEQRTSLDQFVDFALTHAETENSNRNLQKLGRELSYVNSYYWSNDPDEKTYRSQRQKIADFLWHKFEQAPANSDQQKTLFDSWIKVASSTKDLDTALVLLASKDKNLNVLLDQDRRWKIILKLNEFAWKQHIDLATKEAQKDTSDRGQLNLLASQAIRPQSDIKDYWLKKIVSPEKDYNLSQLRSVIAVLFPSSQKHLLKEHATSLYAMMPTLAKKADERFMKAFTWKLIPITCDQKSTKRVQKAIKEYRGLSPTLDKALLNANHDNERCIAIGKLLEAQDDEEI